MSRPLLSPTVVALALAPPIVAVVGVCAVLAVVEAVRSWCPCGSSTGCTHGSSHGTHGSSHGSSHGAYTAITAPEETAGRRTCRGVTAL